MCRSPLGVEMGRIANYSEWVDRKVRGSIGSKSLSWDVLLQSLPGIYPATVLESAERQGLVSRIAFPQGSRLISRGTSDTVGPSIYPATILPTPHPLDSCWWFDPAAIEALIALIDNLTTETAHVILLGAPTLLDAVGRLAKNSRRSFTLVDSDPLVADRLRARANGRTVLVADLMRQTVSVAPGTLVIADPPWYGPEIRMFLWAARQACEVGGHVVTSVPPMGTRPGIEAEWKTILQWSVGLGLRLRKYQHRLLPYLSPVFEENAMFAASVPPPASAWRRGDLATFRCVSACRNERPEEMSHAEWQERVINEVRIRFREGRSINGWSDPTLHRIAESDILPTVSRRDHRLGLVDVWTSGNRVFACEGTAVALQILDAIAVGQNAVSRVGGMSGRSLSSAETSMVQSTEAKLREIIGTEAKEVAAWRERHARVDGVTR